MAALPSCINTTTTMATVKLHGVTKRFPFKKLGWYPMMFKLLLLWAANVEFAEFVGLTYSCLHWCLGLFHICCSFARKFHGQEIAEEVARAYSASVNALLEEVIRRKGSAPLVCIGPQLATSGAFIWAVLRCIALPCPALHWVGTCGVCVCVHACTPAVD